MTYQLPTPERIITLRLIGESTTSLRKELESCRHEEHLVEGIVIQDCLDRLARVESDLNTLTQCMDNDMRDLDRKRKAERNTIDNTIKQLHQMTQTPKERYEDEIRKGERTDLEQGSAMC